MSRKLDTRVNVSNLDTFLRVVICFRNHFRVYLLEWHWIKHKLSPSQVSSDNVAVIWVTHSECPKLLCSVASPIAESPIAEKENSNSHLLTTIFSMTYRTVTLKLVFGFIDSLSWVFKLFIILCFHYHLVLKRWVLKTQYSSFWKISWKFRDFRIILFKKNGFK